MAPVFGSAVAPDAVCTYGAGFATGVAAGAETLGITGLCAYALGVDVPSALIVAKGPAPNWPGRSAVSCDCELLVLGIAGVGLENVLIGVAVAGVDVCIPIFIAGIAGFDPRLNDGAVVAGFTLIAPQLIGVGLGACFCRRLNELASEGVVAMVTL